MKSRADARLREECARFRLRFTCDACAAFDPEREACVYGYPTEEHRDATASGGEVVFCKAFEVA